MLEVYTKSPNLVVLQDTETQQKFELLIYPDGYFKLAKQYKLLGTEEEFYESIPDAIKEIQIDLTIIRQRISTITQIASHINFSMNPKNIKDSDLSDKNKFKLFHIDNNRRIFIHIHEESYDHPDQISVEYYQSFPRDLLWKKEFENNLSTVLRFFQTEFTL